MGRLTKKEKKEEESSMKRTANEAGLGEDENTQAAA